MYVNYTMLPNLLHPSSKQLFLLATIKLVRIEKLHMSTVGLAYHMYIEINVTHQVAFTWFRLM